MEEVWGNKKINKTILIFLNMRRRDKVLILGAYVLVASLIILILKPRYLYSIFIVLVPPTVVNFIWLKNSRKKIFAFSLASTVLFAFAVELVSQLAGAWDVDSLLPRVFGIIPPENILFAFINFFWVLSFYEYFVDLDYGAKINPKFKYLILIFSIFSAIVFSLFFFSPAKVAMDYALVALVVLIIPSLIIFSKNPKLIKKTFLPVVFFSFVFFVYECAALIIGNWWWPGNYLWTVNLFGNVFPIDDVVIWYILSTIALIGGYEFFMDDFK